MRSALTVLVFRKPVLGFFFLLFRFRDRGGSFLILNFLDGYRGSRGSFEMFGQDLINLILAKLVDLFDRTV